VIPVPSNAVRTAILDFVHLVYSAQAVKYGVGLAIMLNSFYFYCTIDFMVKQGSFLSPIESARTEMEQISLYRNERNAFLTGGNLFMYAILRRLVDIQDQLRRARIASKEHDKIEAVIRGSKKNT
jgi:hypothetical protein